MPHLRNNLNFERNTKFIFVLGKLLSSPLEAMCGLLAFILYKELHATPLQITLLISSKPIVALLSFYGNLLIQGTPHRLKPLIIGFTFLGFCPFLLFPFTNNVWLFILAYAIFMMSNRAIIPAWSEILRVNLSHQERGKIFSLGSTANYLTHVLVPLIISPWIDLHPNSWKLIFFILALMHCLNVVVFSLIKINSVEELSTIPNKAVHSMKSLLMGPWKNSWLLMKERADFRRFQLVFMLGGGGLMLMHPVLPIFFKQTLQLSYTELTLATSLCKGLSFAISSPIWASWLHRISLHVFNGYVTCLAGLFALFLIASEYHIYAIYMAYLLYGVMQAGSELSWNLSGPIFSKDQDSTLFTGVNVAMVGVRGCFIPFLGELLFLYSNAVVVFFAGACLCFLGSTYSMWLSYSGKKELVGDEKGYFSRYI